MKEWSLNRRTKNYEHIKILKSTKLYENSDEKKIKLSIKAGNLKKQ